ncbi:hypothetical protein HWC99_gp47 [Flavobacterium phage vB_FspS_tant8-1]|uniref:Uncharacterized protein n=1 Tax=Flavobacterium phage vB_FspS_tant8-1 TaxID=2686278 RepID=A0A6B9LPB0_9CAUD|nr:hypothetical protein HWC99_gp47 [Flavobacterium phage vB_FspS_tant8-1]QHB40978.1 hypothetical protein tant81_gp047 [Flavobacterium phage vB_FspS_tant8-1]
MSLTNLQNKPIVVGSPIEIEFACDEIRKVLSTLSWIDRPYFIAQRFFKTQNGRSFYFPETYAPDKAGSRNYQRLTPDNDFKGQFFFMVGTGRPEFEPNQFNFISYPVGIIFSVNLELIDKMKLDNGLFTQELIREARRLLTNTMLNHEFEYTIEAEIRDLRECFREFVIDEIESYNRAPMQTFRFDLTIKIQEDCNI